MPYPLPPPTRTPDHTASDYWPLLQQHVPPELFDTDSWPRLAAAAQVLPSSAFLLERTLTSPRLIQFGTHIWPWRMDAVLASQARHPHAAFLAQHVHAWRAIQGAGHPYLHLMAMWDEPAGTAPPAPQVFLALFPDTPWRPAVHALADRLSDTAVAQAWHRCADTPHENVVALGVYRGPRDLPTRLTLTSRGPRPWPDHPNWPAVERIVDLAGELVPSVAVPPTAEPGPLWHIPIIAARHPRPHQALAPLIAALRERGLVNSATAHALSRPPQLIPVPQAALLDGQPALLRLLFSLERIKIVVENGAWVSAKACYLVRPVWRTAKRVWVEE